MATAPSRVTLMQTLIDVEYCKIPTLIIHESVLKPENLSIFDHPRPIGISPAYSALTGTLLALAIADDTNCCIVEFYSPKPNHGRGEKQPRSRNLQGRELLQGSVLCRPLGDLFAFDLGPLSMSLYCHIGMRIANGVDIQSAFSKVGRKPLDTIKAAVGDTVPIMAENITNVFRNPIYDRDDKNRHTDLAMRAWVSQFVAGLGTATDTFADVRKIDTEKFRPEQLEMIAKLAQDALRLDHLKPQQVKHDITHPPDGSTSQAKVLSETYKNKVRPDQNVRMTVRNNSGATYTVPGQVGEVSGKSAAIHSSKPLAEGIIITSLTTIGCDGPTTAEAQRAAIILSILQGSVTQLADNPWLQNIWLPSDNNHMIWPEEWSTPISCPAAPSDGNLGRHNLNNSQQCAVNNMLSPADSHRICLIQGPPGTGKTSVIASFVQLAVCAGHKGIWLVAQSNVAVKNIAEKLASIGFMDWRLLVSKDFHFQWHEHLYHKIQPNIIRSDKFRGAWSQIHGCHVILCTLSMLSNPSICTFTTRIPVKTLIVDEASQIEIGDYLAVFIGCHRTLRKVCFIGDDKQLPPYGQEELGDLQSVFEVSHLQKLITFLDTQYRMPPQIGGFISDAVYDGKLLSNPDHPITGDIIACYFIDVDGKERMQNQSYMNVQECQVVLRIAQHLQDQGKSYRIITPYEAQRSMIEAGMKKIEGLHWGDKCFNVDSFQGNEDDYIIISLVRSQQLGFLKNLRRTNVMLTRCKHGMFITSSSRFLAGTGATSLVGKLAKSVGKEAWLEMKDVIQGNF